MAQTALAASLSLAALVLAASSALADSPLAVTKKDCAAITRHVPAPDVEYKPGSDVRGRPVAPADLAGGSPIQLPDEITINIGIDLEKKYGLGAGGKYTGEGVIGKVTVKNGRVFFNDKPLDAGDQRAIAEACRQMYERKR